MSTATKATPVTFRDRIKGLERKELAVIAKEEFQLNVESRVKKDALRDTLIRYHEERVTSSMEKNKAAAQLFLERDPNEQLVTVQFLPLDFPNNPEKFSWDGNYGIRDRKNPGRNPNGLSKMANFFLVPNEIYQLPICVVNHLESKTFRDAKPVFDHDTGCQAGVEPIIKQRFMCRLIMSDDAMNNMGTRNFT